MSDPTSTPCSRSVLADYIASSEPGSRLTYFTANNANGYRGLDYVLKESLTPTLRAVVNEVRALYNAGFVDLVQDRTSQTETLYIAIWRKYKAPAAGSLNRLPMVE